jgi:Holliday junction resolvasome RuvABC endonuclease subunit
MRNSILSIDPGTRYWGASVFHGTEIMICMIKNLSVKDSAKNRLPEVRKIFLKLCNRYSPDVLVIEQSQSSWEDQSEHLAAIVREVKRLAMKKKIRIVEFSPSAIRKAVCGDERATKAQIADVVCRTYPEFKGYLDEHRTYRNKYWERMLGSMGLGICYFKTRKGAKISC